MVLTAIAVVLAVLALAAWLFIRWWRKRPKPAPPTPRAIALRELDALRARVERTEPYKFSIAVSDVLRGFIAGSHGTTRSEIADAWKRLGKH